MTERDDAPSLSELASACSIALSVLFVESLLFIDFRIVILRTDCLPHLEDQRPEEGSSSLGSLMFQHLGQHRAHPTPRRAPPTCLTLTLLCCLGLPSILLIPASDFALAVTVTSESCSIQLYLSLTAQKAFQVSSGPS